MKIIGLRIEKYIDKVISGHNCDFEYSDKEFEKHIICAVLNDNRKIEIELSYSVGECMSGWTTASWGKIIVTEVENFNGYSYVPKSTLFTDDIQPGFDGDISNDVFSVYINGGCEYYPSGRYNVKMELFQETCRTKKIRPVWIFKGESNLGKSFLASKLNDLEVYETDSIETLPVSITASVIVMGNKYNHSLDDIEAKLFGEVEIHLVDFSLLPRNVL